MLGVLEKRFLRKFRKGEQTLIRLLQESEEILSGRLIQFAGHVVHQSDDRAAAFLAHQRKFRHFQIKRHQTQLTV